MTLKLNIPICLEKIAGNDGKIVVRQPIFKGNMLNLANNDDDDDRTSAQGKRKESSAQWHKQGSQHTKTNMKRKGINKSWRSSDIRDGSE